MGISEVEQVTVTSRMITNMRKRVEKINEDMERYQRLMESEEQEEGAEMWRRYVVEASEDLVDLRSELVLCIPAHVRRLEKFGKCPICLSDLQDKINWYKAFEAELLTILEVKDSK